MSIWKELLSLSAMLDQAPDQWSYESIEREIDEKRQEIRQHDEEKRNERRRQWALVAGGKR